MFLKSSYNMEVRLFTIEPLAVNCNQRSHFW